MSSFQFGFNFDNNDNDIEETVNGVKESMQLEQRELKPMHVMNIEETFTTHLESIKHVANWKHDLIQIGNNNNSLKRIHPSVKPFASQDSSTTNTSTRLDETSDLISGVYEGGLKVWECSIDLCNYLSEDLSHGLNQVCSPLGGSVLELGCGRK
jgi:hypothetical protein